SDTLVPTTYLVDTTLSNSSDSDQTVQAVRLRLIRLITSNSGSSPCLIGHGGLPSPVTQTTCFLELAEAIRDYRAVTLLVNGKSYEAVAPRRLIFQSKNWFLVATHTRNLQVFRMEDVNAVTVLDTSFCSGTLNLAT
ncbi:WYL domain-containing protein, partial [Escherichia coli]|uniref:WYL domain-containing protein n=1 Tax=Escherichia coli TaxID=562 RepID=UPI0030F3CB96